MLEILNSLHLSEHIKIIILEYDDESLYQYHKNTYLGWLSDQKPSLSMAFEISFS